ncbi:MAG: Ig-like domain-containing protein, partial [Nocardioides sp.]
MEHPYLTGSTTTLQEAVFNGTVDPGNIVLVREVLSSPGAGTDTALFTGAIADYTVTTGADGWTTVTDNVGTDGVDRVRNVERLQFANGVIALAGPSAPVIGNATAGDGNATVNFTAGAVGEQLTGFRVQVITGGNVVRTVSGIGPTATLAVISGLTNGTPYTFQVIAVNALGDSAPSAESNSVTPASGALTVQTTPVNGATNVSPSANLTGTFNRDVTSPNWTNAVQLRNAAGTLVGRTVTYAAATRTVTVNPNANLVPGESYTLRFVGTGINGIRDLNGVRLPNTVVNFVPQADTTAPTVTTSTPADNATGVAPAASVLVNFSERITGVSPATVVLENIANPANPVPIATTLTLSPAGTRITINPTPNLALNTLYRVTLVGGTNAIRDAVNNPLATTTVTFRIRP